MQQLDIAILRDAVTSKAAIRRRQRLQPTGGPGDKIFPPTYPGDGRNAPPRHVYDISTNDRRFSLAGRASIRATAMRLQ